MPELYCLKKVFGPKSSVEKSGLLSQVKSGEQNIVHFHTVHSLQSMACYTFFTEHTANFAIKMIQVLTKISSWRQKCIDFSGMLVLFLIGQKIKELFQLFEGSDEIK